MDKICRHFHFALKYRILKELPFFKLGWLNKFWWLFNVYFFLLTDNIWRHASKLCEIKLWVRENVTLEEALVTIAERKTTQKQEGAHHKIPVVLIIFKKSVIAEFNVFFSSF